MNLKKKTDDWVKNRLISKEQQKSILKNEDRHFFPFVLFGFLWVGILCVLVGLVSLGHTHWSLIPEQAKIVTFLFGLIILALVLFYSIKKNKKFVFETALFIAFLMIGGGIGLCAQLFDLPFNNAKGLFLWSILSFFIVLLSKKEFLILLWIPLFLGGIIGFLKLELLILFFEQAPLFSTLILAGFFFLCFWLTRNAKTNWGQAIFKWSILLYVIVVFLGDRATNHVVLGFSLFAFFLLLLIAISVKERRILLFNFISLFLVLRLVMLFFQLSNDLHITGIGFLTIGILILLLGSLWLFVEKKILSKGLLLND